MTGANAEGNNVDKLTEMLLILRVFSNYTIGWKTKSTRGSQSVLERRLV